MPAARSAAELVQAAEWWRADLLAYTGTVSTVGKLAAYWAAGDGLITLRDEIGIVAEMRLIMLIGAHQTCE